MLVINPDECIDCALCEPECPVDAIFAEDDLPERQSEFLLLNKDLSHSWRNIAEPKLPLPDAEQWKHTTNKRQFLEQEWPNPSQTEGRTKSN